MSLVERVNRLMDLELAKKSLLLFSAGLLILIPADGLSIYLQKTRPIQSGSPSQEKAPLKLDPEESYLTAFEGSTLFGNASLGLSAPVLQASVAELAKDYRLKGVVLADEPEAIVEDARTQKTLFVEVGGRLGELTVKEIKEGFIILAYLGEETRLDIQ